MKQKGSRYQLPPARRQRRDDLPRRRPGKRDTREPYQRIHDESISEYQLQIMLMETGLNVGWLIHHETDSRKSYPGFPDLVCVHPRYGIVYIELKAERGYLDQDQYDWRDYLVSAGANYYVFRPRDRHVATAMLETGEYPPMEAYLT